jgi:hypothetical protein
MKELLTPERIYNGVLTGEMSKNLAQNQLISLIEVSNTPQIRSKAIDIINELNFREIEVFKVIENSLLSDESALVRNSAVELICNIFLNEGFDSLLWVLDNEKSPLVLNTILHLVNDVIGTEKELLNKKSYNILNYIAKRIGISEDEARFIIELESKFALNNNNYIIDFESYKYVKLLRNSKKDEPWLKIQNSHIVSLTLNYFNWIYIKQNIENIDSIMKVNHLRLFLDVVKSYGLMETDVIEVPESIKYLTQLKHLDLSNNLIKYIPDTFSMLTHLVKLNLRYNNFKTIPKVIFSLPLLKCLDIRDNGISHIPSDNRSFLNSLAVFKY